MHEPIRAARPEGWGTPDSPEIPGPIGGTGSRDRPRSPGDTGAVIQPHAVQKEVLATPPLRPERGLPATGIIDRGEKNIVFRRAGERPGQPPGRVWPERNPSGEGGCRSTLEAMGRGVPETVQETPDRAGQVKNDHPGRERALVRGGRSPSRSRQKRKQAYKSKQKEIHITPETTMQDARRSSLPRA